MSLEEAISEQTREVKALVQAVQGKQASIDARVLAKLGDMDQWMLDNTPEKRWVKDITIGGSTDKCYPVWWMGESPGEAGVTRINIGRPFNWNEDTRPLNKASAHQASLLLVLEQGDCAWGGGPTVFKYLHYAYVYNPTVSHPSFSMYCKEYKLDNSKPSHNRVENGAFGQYCSVMSGLYLRGGGLKYRIIANRPLLNFGFHDGSGAERVIHTADHVNTRWEAEPIPFDADEAKRYCPAQTTRG
ncbi:hypothetical protein ACUHMQ_16390 [Chitinimonas sp. PSY-7]|uniref:hypothetical protein n=1 Tax=Chitinimonas sp. PSY-7 TaxID=3459088 RepID=UPI00403FFC50